MRFLIACKIQEQISKSFLSTMALELPTLDFSKFLHGTQAERQEVADQLVASFTSHGFTKLINHEISDEVIEGIWHWVSTATP